jgi:hypothetical protein
MPFGQPNPGSLISHPDVGCSHGLFGLLYNIILFKY